MSCFDGIRAIIDDIKHRYYNRKTRGMTLSEVKEYADSKKYYVRIQHGDYYPLVTYDLRRFNVRISNGIVTEFVGFY